MLWTALLLITALDERIVIDSDFDDWADIAPIVRDARDDAAGSPVDIADVQVTHDAQFVYFAFDLQKTVNLQVLPGELQLVVDADGDPDTGAARAAIAGADWVVTFTPRNPERPDRPGMGAGLEVASGDGFEPRSPYDVGLIQAPTHASSRFEVRMERRPQSGVRAIAGKLRARLLFFDASGEQRDATQIFEYELTKVDPVVTVQGVDPLARRRGAPLRLMNWNVLWGKVFEDPAPFARVLRAVDPDLITFQELTGKDLEGRLARWLEQTAPAQEARWTVTIGELGGGDLFSAVATKLPARPVDIRVPSRRDRSVRETIAAQVIEDRGEDVLVISIHLPCCGGIGSPQDEARLRVVADLTESLKGWLNENEVSGAILAGDYNLVGSKEPLTKMKAGLSRLVGSASAASLLRLDGRSTATWRDPKQPFVPGQLDWVLVGGELETAGGFVLDTRDVSPVWRGRYGLLASDTDASDHLPLVVDFR